jgi:hypothetical protein
MPIQIGHGPDHDFDQPLGLLSDCHRRIEHFLRVLVAVDDRAAGGPLAADHRRALEGALRYFEVAAPKHTADAIRRSRSRSSCSTASSTITIRPTSITCESMRWCADGWLTTGSIRTGRPSCASV